jgi:hypothetical protein
VIVSDKGESECSRRCLCCFAGWGLRRPFELQKVPTTHMGSMDARLLPLKMSRSICMIRPGKYSYQHHVTRCQWHYLSRWPACLIGMFPGSCLDLGSVGWRAVESASSDLTDVLMFFFVSIMNNLIYRRPLVKCSCCCIIRCCIDVML